jgi:hypothetical protein
MYVYRIVPRLSEVFSVSQYFDMPLSLTQYFSSWTGSGLASHPVTAAKAKVAKAHRRIGTNWTAIAGFLSLSGQGKA